MLSLWLPENLLPEGDQPVPHGSVKELGFGGMGANFPPGQTYGRRTRQALGARPSGSHSY